MEATDPIEMRRALLAADDHRATDDGFDLDGELRAVLSPLGLSPEDTGGTITWDKLDPLMPSNIRLGGASAVALVQQAVVAASIWKDRTGQSQDIGIDLGQAIRRLAPATELKWELVNGLPPDVGDMSIGLLINPFPTKDGRYVVPANVYPKLKTAMLAALGCDDTPRSIGAAIASHTADELEQMAEAGGFVMAKVRSIREFVEEPVFAELASHPLIEVEKVGESDPEPFDEFSIAPLSGIRALGMGHVIAGAAIGRSLAAYGADVLQVWRPMDAEQEAFMYTSNIGTRSTRIPLRSEAGRAQVHALLKDADVFFANRRPGFLSSIGMDLEQAVAVRPGLVHVNVTTHGETGPWKNRVGFDQPAGAVTGTLVAEGSLEKPSLPPTSIVNDYLVGWLAATGAMVALKRRAVEGGSYRVHVSLDRAAMWLNSLGFFDPEYVQRTVGTGGQHELIDPQLFRASTPMGIYQGVTEQVTLTKTPTHYTAVYEPRGSAQPVWLPKPEAFDSQSFMQQLLGKSN